MKKVRVVVTGRVQGVWFRGTTCDKARALGVRGYVRNQADGSVEFVAEGEDIQVDELVRWARQGPPVARVDNIKIDVLPYKGEYGDFRVSY